MDLYQQRRQEILKRRNRARTRAEKQREYQRTFYLRNADRIRARNRENFRAYYQQHRDEILSRQRKRYFEAWLKSEGLVKPNKRQMPANFRPCREVW